jgi:hypothetical protein
MAIRFEDFAAYARLSDADLEEPGERLTAELCYEAAIDSARSCGIPVDTLENRKMELYIYALALYEFDNRGFSLLNTSLAAQQNREKKMTQMKLELELEGWAVPALPFERAV